MSWFRYRVRLTEGDLVLQDTTTRWTVRPVGNLSLNPFKVCVTNSVFRPKFRSETRKIDPLETLRCVQVTPVKK